MLSSHPRIVISPETGLFPEILDLVSGEATVEATVEHIRRHPRWPDFQIDVDILRSRLALEERLTLAAILKTFYGCMPPLSEKPRWGDKTPTLARYLPELAGIWENACFIHVIRDPRSVVASLVRVPFGPKTVKDAAWHWRAMLTACRTSGRRVRHYIEIHYESLIRAPETELRRLCAFTGEEFEPTMLEFHRRDGPERLAAMTKNSRFPERRSYHSNIARPLDPSLAEQWRDQLTPADLDALHRIAGALMVNLGYQP